MTLDMLLAPVSEEAPAGPDLSYDAERQAIEQAFETQGYSSELGEDVDWRETLRQIEAQSGRTKDVWLAVYMARVGTRIGSLETIETGCAMLAGLFESYWDSVHPTIEDYGLQGRKGACESLTRIAEFLRPLQRTVLIEHPRLGRYSGEDFVRFAQDGDAAEGFGLFRAAMAETPVEAVQAVLARLDAIAATLQRTDAVMGAHAVEMGDQGTNFAPAFEAIAAIRRAVLPYAGAEVEAADTIVEDDRGQGGALPAKRKESSGDRVESREDAVLAIEAICAYYRRREPSSPIPIALRHAL